MKKNSIDAFAGKEAALEKITGGYYTRDTVFTNNVPDCETVTETGELNQYGVIFEEQGTMGDGIVVYDSPDTGGGGATPIGPRR